MAKSKTTPKIPSPVNTQSAVDIDDLRNLIEPARAIAEALSSIDKNCGLGHDSLWRLGSEIQQKLDQAIEMLDRFEGQDSPRDKLHTSEK